jgi:hypothetical protein
MKRISISLVAAAATAFAVPACSNDVSQPGGDDDGSGSSSGTDDPYEKILGERKVDYSYALRIAALRLTGDLPSMAEVNQVASATGDAQRAAYETLIRAYLDRQTFAAQALNFWRDTFKMGGSAMLDAAPAFAAKLTVENGSYLDLFTKPNGNCPTVSTAGGITTFADADCANGGPKAGVITNTGVQAQFFSNFAFRRVRWLQETFDCLRFPTELSKTPTEVGGAAPYLGVWPFASVAAPSTGGRVDFQNVASAVCANCHGTINHIAPLFAYYDGNGAYKTAISVPTPLAGTPPPLAALTDYLAPGEAYAWRYGKPTPDIPAFGAALAADPEVAACGVARIWNFALGYADIVDQLVEVPLETIQTQVTAFTQNNYRLKDAFFAAFTSEAFVKF